MVNKLAAIGLLFGLASIASSKVVGVNYAIEQKLSASHLSPQATNDIANISQRTTISTGREHHEDVLAAQSSTADYDPRKLYPPHYLSIPIDHFHNESKYAPHTHDTFPLRYWFDAQFYTPGGPVIVLQGGETSGVGRLKFLQKGIVYLLARATGGIGVILEHRYYGTSMPLGDKAMTTEGLRFLTFDQAMADQAYFARHVVFEGLEAVDLTAPGTPWIAYGGSYAGGFSAIIRKIYPHVFWGGVSSSGVVEAIWDYWAYFEPIRVFGEPKCIATVQKITNMADNIVIGLKDTKTTADLKTVFGMANVTHDSDFMAIISEGIIGWQNQNWDPALNDLSVERFCGNVTSQEIIYEDTAALNETVYELLKKGGYESEALPLAVPLLNWIGWLHHHTVKHCKVTQDQCFSQHNSTFYRQDDIKQTWRAWPYQFCTEWGYLATGSGVPEHILPLISRTSTMEHNSIVCVEAFNITSPPYIENINKHGGFNIAYPRLAMIDGDRDPWRPATAHASPFNETAINRTSTTSEPFILIENAIHHFDENGLFANQTVQGKDILPPQPVRDAQAQIVSFVKEWMVEWETEKARSGMVTQTPEFYPEL
ncbi:serine carboxypeptidase S28-domain-containing protein [Calycina marina]|uniref:Serine carboxypeptidase S28-domain-containing protein n=1 Tax=Calycina marina TaxID=1763456 RepID=A0A9P7YZZ8_9HELO|nr:serine carboxypeptidase S28-domain-containing protein [Calycina marina]